MKLSGDSTIDFPVATVWDALLDPRVLVSTIPGCERLEATGDNAYAMTVTAGVASIRGTYSGSCTLSDLQPHESLVMTLQGSGAPGTIGATVDVRFEQVDEGATRISYEADAVVGGMVGGVGQRMLTSVSRRMANEFFSNVAGAIAEPRSETEEAATPATKGVFTAPPRAGGIGSQDDFLKGIAVGAGLVLLGVAAGAVLAGRRR
jgi:carbon monoxide dehydrogenase subunit G